MFRLRPALTCAAAALSCVAGGLAGAAPAFADYAPVPCEMTAALLGPDDAARSAAVAAQVIPAFEFYSPMRTVVVGDRKTLYLEHAKSVTFSDGCRLDLAFDVTLDRRLRRDAKGTLKIHGLLAASVDWATLNFADRTISVRACVENPSIDSLDLSHTTNVGENIYTRHANLPNEICLDPFTLPFA